MADNKILIGKVTLENFLIFIFTFILSLIVAHIVYVVIRSFLDKKLPQRNSKNPPQSLSPLSKYVNNGKIVIESLFCH